MYSQDYDDALPRAKVWMDVTEPYIKNATVYQCPEAHSRDANAYGYAYYSKLSGKNRAKILNPAIIGLIYDSSNTAYNASDEMTSLPEPPRHQRFNNMGFLDGHAKSLSTGVSLPVLTR